MRRLVTVSMLSVALLATAAGCGDDDSGSSTSAATGTQAGTTTEPPTTQTAAACQPAEAPPPKDVDIDAPTDRLQRDETYVVKLETSCGDIDIRLDQRKQPKTAASFAHLVRAHVLDDTTFHRVVPDFVIQGGDPAGNGTGGPGYSVTERPPRDAAYTRGVVAMAKSAMEDPGTSGSQFFIVTGPDVGLPPDYALVGTVTGGMDTVDRIEAVPTDASDTPTEAVVIESATLSEE